MSPKVEKFWLYESKGFFFEEQLFSGIRFVASRLFNSFFFFAHEILLTIYCNTCYYFVTIEVQCYSHFHTEHLSKLPESDVPVSERFSCGYTPSTLKMGLIAIPASINCGVLHAQMEYRRCKRIY